MRRTLNRLSQPKDRPLAVRAEYAAVRLQITHDYIKVNGSVEGTNVLDALLDSIAILREVSEPPPSIYRRIAAAVRLSTIPRREP